MTAQSRQAYVFWFVVAAVDMLPFLDKVRSCRATVFLAHAKELAKKTSFLKVLLRSIRKATLPS